MTTCLLAFALALSVAALATLLARKAGLRLGIVDQPDAFRKVHRRPIPRVGGAGVLAGFLVATLFFLHIYPLFRGEDSAFLRGLGGAEELGLIAGALIAFAAGLMDDVRGLRPRWKLLLQALAGLAAWAGGYSIPGISLPFGAPAISLGPLALPLTLFWFVACMNAVNLLDGLDGLAAGVCLFVCMTLMLTCVHLGRWTDAFLLTCFGGALLGFLLFNFHPASIFLGDCGSLLLGFLVAALSLRGARKAETAVALLIPVIALGVPIFDSTLAILRRWSRRLPISAADRQHIHHALLALGLSHKRVVLTLYAVCVGLGMMAFSIAVGRGEGVVVVMGALVVVAFVCMRMLGGVRLRDLWTRVLQDRETRLRSDEARLAVESGVQRIEAAVSQRDLWAAFCETAEALGLDHARLKLAGADGRT
ncbi:MAG TPA: MraY family glycosyltransferase, partial [Candidatus Brocadiia bacterium]|nr:MraY family glycosyltransferase [Candidatus Brocadiia bacterium]